MTSNQLKRSIQSLADIRQVGKVAPVTPVLRFIIPSKSFGVKQIGGTSPIGNLSFGLAVSLLLLISVAAGQQIDQAAVDELPIRIVQENEGLESERVSIFVGSELFTAFVPANHGRPILYPVYGPGQVSMTRHWPMADAPEGVVEAHDHPHHKSLWYGHEVNGVDFWTERSGKIEVKNYQIDPTANSLEVNSEWIRNADSQIVCRDRVVYRFDGDSKKRWVDVTITFFADDLAVTLDDTKEGFFAIRTHPHLRLSPAPREGVNQVFGKAINSEGDIDKQVWGKRARWLLYYGPVQGNSVGIAIFDHPENLRHPTTWHARDYGLIAANPFALHEMLNKPRGSGDYRIDPSSSLSLRYRMVFIGGEVDSEFVESLYQEFSK